jgi:hypothetical protein
MRQQSFFSERNVYALPAKWNWIFSPGVIPQSLLEREIFHCWGGIFYFLQGEFMV